MAVNPLRTALLALNHPEGLPGARRDLAEALGCHPDSIRNIDSGYRNPHRDFAKQIEAEMAKRGHVVRAADLVFWSNTDAA